MALAFLTWQLLFLESARKLPMGFHGVIGRERAQWLSRRIKTSKTFYLQ